MLATFLKIGQVKLLSFADGTRFTYTAYRPAQYQISSEKVVKNIN
jgi:hypothetical protein